MNLIALIPARAGSKRIPNKNIKLLGGHPLIAYAVQSALDSDIFDDIFVSSDSDRICEIAIHYGARFIKRPSEFATDTSPDSEWIEHAFDVMADCGAVIPPYYCILRPTNPFRTAAMINRAWNEWDHTSIMKAIEPVKQHPYKMWGHWWGKYIEPLFDLKNNVHLNPTQTLGKFHVQNGSLEFRPITKFSGYYQPFITQDYEGFDLNTIEDWILAEALIEKGYAELPKIDKKPFNFIEV